MRSASNPIVRACSRGVKIGSIERDGDQREQAGEEDVADENESDDHHGTGLTLRG